MCRRTRCRQAEDINHVYMIYASEAVAALFGQHTSDHPSAIMPAVPGKHRALLLSGDIQTGPDAMNRAKLLVYPDFANVRAGQTKYLLPSVRRVECRRTDLYP